jgi:Zn-dependent M16 (insulinase) family peptidase
MTALSVLLDYMTDTAISPMQKAFVEIESPLASKVYLS